MQLLGQATCHKNDLMLIQDWKSIANHAEGFYLICGQPSNSLWDVFVWTKVVQPKPRSFLYVHISSMCSL